MTSEHRVEARVEDAEGRAVERFYSWSTANGGQATHLYYVDGGEETIVTPPDPDDPGPSNEPLGPEWREVGYTSEDGDGSGSQPR